MKILCGLCSFEKFCREEVTRSLLYNALMLQNAVLNNILCPGSQNTVWRQFK